MVHCKLFCVVQREAFTVAVVVAGLVELGNFLFGQAFFRRRRKSRIQSREAVVEAGDLQPHQLLQVGLYDAALV